MPPLLPKRRAVYALTATNSKKRKLELPLSPSLGKHHINEPSPLTTTTPLVTPSANESSTAFRITTPVIEDGLPPASTAPVVGKTPRSNAASAEEDPDSPPKGGTLPDRELDELDTLVAKATEQYLSASSWEEFFNQQKDPKGDLADVLSLKHPAARLLDCYKREGVPVSTNTPPWTKARKLAALARGPHKSAKEHVEFLRTEYASMMKKGHWTLIPAQLIVDLPDLRLSPLGVVPQHDRRPRTISDYTYFGVNEDTVALAPQEAMQFGRALHRLLQKIHDANPRYGPVKLAKVDIADGFYRIGIRPLDALKLAVLFPRRKGEEPLIGIPLTLPMGWKESPPAFCTATETTADLANRALTNTSSLYDRPHRLDKLAETPIPPESAPQPRRDGDTGNTPVPVDDSRKLYRPLQYWDVYVDDFLGLGQGSKRRLRMIKRALLHSLDLVFRPLENGDLPTRQEPASVKKLKKGDATWSTRKIMLGWLINTAKGTIELPPHRVERLHTILNSISTTQRTIAENVWHKVLGELRSMAVAIPGARGLFSLLQEALRHRESSRPRIRLSKAVHRVLDDFRWLAKDIGGRPTRLAELLPSDPRVYGAVDAAKTGMGGVFFVPTTEGEASDYASFLWRAPFPKKVQREVVSFKNPAGSINNSDLELCGNIAHHSVLSDTVDLRERTVWTGSDNTANVHWLRKGSTTTTGPPAHLLRIQAMHQRYHRYVPSHDYVPGTANKMADVCSRAWHLSDSQLIAHFNSSFPQNRSWQICHLNSEMASALTSALCRTPSPLEFVRKLHRQRMPIGNFGPNFALASILTPSLEGLTKVKPSPSCKSSAKCTETDEYPPAATPLQLAGYRMSSVRWARRSGGWGPKTPG